MMNELIKIHEEIKNHPFRLNHSDWKGYYDLLKQMEINKGVKMIYKENCIRCGQCCMSLPNWKDLSEIDKAMIRILDRKAEEIFKKVVKGKCPNLVFEDGIARCLVYDNRFNFCKAFICYGDKGEEILKTLKGGEENGRRRI